MFAIECELLTGRYVATRFDDRATPEWPPHPARVFSALVATWAEGGMDAEERRALEWLAAQDPPGVVASDAYERTTVTVFVPVNDRHAVSVPQRLYDQVSQAAESLAALGEAAGRARASAQRKLERARARLAEGVALETAAVVVPSKAAMRDAEAALPDSRPRQARHFPSVTPVAPSFTMVWETDSPEPMRDPLVRLCRRVVRVGHSSSLVRVRFVTGLQIDPDSTWYPDRDGPMLLRVVPPGQLQALVDAHAQHGEVEPRLLPYAPVRYRRGPAPLVPALPASAFSEDWLVFERTGGPRLPISAAAAVSKALRGALLRYSDQPSPKVLSGHDEAGPPAEGGHLACVALPFVGSAHADGKLLGVALILPRRASTDERAAVYRAVARWEEEERATSGRAEEDTPDLRLTLGLAGVLQIRRVEFGESEKQNLRASTWCRPARLWFTGTPIALDRNPGNLDADDPQKRARAFADAEDSIGLACERIGLPRPASVEVTRSVLIPGTVKPRGHAPFPSESGKTRRVLVHARLWFDEPVHGPILLGAGRYSGLGLCRPFDLEEAVT